MEIRSLTTDDAEPAGRLFVQSAEHHRGIDPDSYRVPDVEPVIAHYEELAVDRDQSVACFVAEHEGSVIGLVVLRLSEPPPDHSMLLPRRTASVDVVVDANQPRLGVGAALMETAESWALENEVDMLMLDMLRANEPALAFYTSLGYEEHGALLVKRHVAPR